MPHARQSEFPEAAIPRAKTLGKASGAFARKPAMEAREAERLDEERRMAKAFSETLDECGLKNTTVADLLGLAEVGVRRLRDRSKPLHARHIAKLPAHAQHVFESKLRKIFPPVVEELRAQCIAANDVVDG